MGKSFLKKGLLWGLAFVFALASTGCSLEQFRLESTQVPELITSIVGDPKTFNYAISNEVPNIFTYTYEGLVTQNPLTSEIEPALAESWQLSDDSLTLTFTLRSNLKWSDGQPLTADDVVFTYNEVYLNPAISTATRDGLSVGEPINGQRQFPTVRQLDERRVEFTVPEPFAPLLLLTSTAILPAHILRETVQKKDEKGQPIFNSTWKVDTDPAKIIVNGPYKLVRYSATERLIFRRNPYYWRYQTGSATGNIERIVWKILESTDNALLQFRSGGLDALGVSASQFQLLKREEKAGNFTILGNEPATGTTFIFFNLNTGKRKGKPLIDPIKSKWFNEVKFRQAVAYAINRPKMLNNAYQGLGAPQHSPISVQSPYYLSPEEGLKTYDYSPEQAKTLLKSAGFKYDAQNQLLDSDGNRVQFVLTLGAGGSTSDILASQIKQDLNDIGIRVDLNPISFNTLVTKLDNTFDWECALLGLSGGVEPHFGKNVWDPEGQTHMFNQQAAAGSSPLEGRTVRDWEQQINQLYIEGGRETDQAKRKAIYAQSQQITQENLPFIYLINALSMTAVRNKFTGIDYSALAGAFWNIYDIKVEDAEIPERSD
ncbi:MAG: ABC transporter substrate-binding protein, partial [Thermosynechococcaceae cyanobacterium]